MSRLGRWGAWLGLPVLAGLATWGAWRGFAEARHSQQEVRALEARRARLEEANRALRREVDALRKEQAARQRAARQSLDVAAPGEVLIVVPPTPAPTATESPAPGAV
ncbi:MAG TPA: septum formation initiator family protein [Thermoanaerobaculaceae bacterium]|nr:septum formation initiator family protein [Thermoanaerobaculaceae bacterium]HRS17605.1 septum formation initiator family protein [Thermoanaerobaculaceae bacterium]